MVMEFNFVMRYMMQELGEELPYSNIIFCDVFQGSMHIFLNFMVSMSPPMLAVCWETTRVFSCVFHQTWLAVMLPTISGGTNFIQLIQSMPF